MIGLWRDRSRTTKKGWARLQKVFLLVASVLALEIFSAAKNLDQPPRWAFAVAVPIALEAYAASLKPQTNWQ